MGFDIKMTGGTELYQLKAQLKQLGDTGLSREMTKRLKSATEPLKTAIQAEIPKTIPSGYAPVLSRSMKYRVSSKTAKQSSAIRYIVFSQGKGDRRDVPALNQGQLRHPVFGRRRQAWVSQKVRAGFADKPLDRLVPEIRREMSNVLNDVAERLVR